MSHRPSSKRRKTLRLWWPESIHSASGIHGTIQAGMSTLTEWLARHYRWLSLLILVLPCFNLTCRLGRDEHVESGLVYAN